MKNNNFQPSDFILTGIYQNEEDVSKLVMAIKRYLDSKGIDIKTRNYKHDKNYKRIRNDRISGFPGGAMSLEEFVDRFMHTNSTFESIYDMGNPNEIEDSLCTDSAIASEIRYILSLDEEIKKGKSGKEEKEDKEYKEGMEKIATAKVLDELERKSGLIERIKKYLRIDLNESGRNDNREKYERSKILYFFYMLEHRLYPNIKVLMLLDKPSMESVDNTFLGWQTHNGKILRTVKESLGKELPLEEKGRIYSTISAISIKWDNILNNAQLLLDFLHDYGFDYSSVELLPSPIPIFMSDEGNQDSAYQYPVERLYLTVSQREYLGNLFDIAFVNDIENSNNYDVPPELVEEMKSLLHKPVDFKNVEGYISDSAQRLSRYVYLGKKATKEDVRRIRTFAHKFLKFLNFCYRANYLINTKEISNELQIVSFLQALILDDQSETFDYTYHGYQDKAKHMMRVQAALKNDNRVPDALQIYWVRKVIDRWYANVGKYDVRMKLRQIEQTCDEIRKQILSQSTLGEMIAAHHFYLEQIDPGFLEVDNQIGAVVHVMEVLQSLGFKYEDRECKMRYAFLDPEECDSICESILVNIQDTIQDRDPSCQIGCKAKGTAIKDAGFFLELAFDYCEKTCILTQFVLAFG